MRRVAFIGLLAILGAIPSLGQQLLSRWVDENVPFLLVDPQSGAATTFGPLITPAPGYPFLEAFDAARQRLYFVNSTSQLEYLDLRTGNFAIVPGPTRPYSAIEYDPLTNLIIAAVLTPPVTVVSIDPVSGATTPIATVNTVMIRYSVSAIDVTGRRFFILTWNGAPDEIVTVHLATGNVTSVPLPGMTRAFFEYDPVSGGVLSTPGTFTNPSIFVIDPVTGVQTVLFSGPWPATGVVSATVSTFDPVTRRLYFVGLDTTKFPLQQSIVTADLNAQTVVAHDVGPGALQFLELAPVPVPSMSGALLTMLAAVLGLTALYALRARV